MLSGIDVHYKPYMKMDGLTSTIMESFLRVVERYEIVENNSIKRNKHIFDISWKYVLCPPIIKFYTNRYTRIIMEVSHE